MDEIQKRATSEVFLWRAQFLFGILLNKLCEDADMSHRELGRRAKAYRKDLRERGHLYNERSTGTIDQSGISRIINIERPPHHSQIYIWLGVIQRHLESETYHIKCQLEGKSLYHLTQELKTDLYRLALCGTPEEIMTTYEKYKYMINESSPEFQAAHRKHLEMLRRN